MAKFSNDEQLESLKKDFKQLKDPVIGRQRILELVKEEEEDLDGYLSPWYKFSKKSKHVYPSQGLLETPYDYLDYHGTQMLPQEVLFKTLRLRRFFLELFNHPIRIHSLKKVDQEKFTPPPKIECRAIEDAIGSGLTLAIGDMGASVVGDKYERISRSERYTQGPFIKLGKYARGVFVGSASPDVWNSAAATATMAASHSLCSIPRNGLLYDVKRQSDFAEEVFDWLARMENQILRGRSDRHEVASMWKRNVNGAIEANPSKALERAKALYDKGVRSFRVYSPEPGTGPIDTLYAMRDEFGDEIELFAGQIVSVNQAKDAQRAGADGLYVGIGGGGRCITGVRSGSVVDWPELVWKFRGEINIPVIAEGGASDHIAITLLLGASGISVTRIVGGGTIESPGGALYYTGKGGSLFKPYGGEASARTKYLDGKLLPFNVPSFVEGETRKSEMSYINFAMPTLTHNLHLLQEDVILSLVFRGVKDIHELHALKPSPIRRITSSGDFQRNTH
ncbi:IMP dehydrogenase [Candidatus Dojkabacteria bacterium]|uniref:IMP dehydrogenase n=1 Tax=Candidatus Dojkabacteria bacterium TaxID=2099670 RepID=A0A955L5A6_9BACT|nr:IMP dehydrogenase [Candidatus Dojkabacteria bacterium]